MDKATIRIGILGAGAVASTHAAAYSTMADVEVVGVFGRNTERTQSVSDICKAEPIPTAEVLIEDVSIDAIDVCLPSAVHPAFVLAALSHGKHVFCETPMALRMEDARAMRDAARRAGRLLQVGLLMRSIGAYQHLKAAVDASTHGRLLSLSTWRLGSYLHPDAPDHKAHYGDPAIELMTFDFDVAQWLMGRPAYLSAAGVGEITALLSYDDGRHATVAASGLLPPGFPFTVGFRALFERAMFELQTVFAAGPPLSTFTISEGKGAPRPVEMAALNPYEVELRRFIDCVRGKADPALLDADRAIEALTLSLATQRALAAGQTVEI
jgi:UDP-N-acetylglucosamine 3-dehydrogenase